MTDFDPFAGLDSELPQAGETRQAPAKSFTQPPAYSHWDVCPKCNGTKYWRPGYPCFACKGKGGKSYRTSASDRAAARCKAQDRKATREVENVENFTTTYPDVAAWLAGNPTFDFAVSLLEAVKRFGSLTENQMAAVQRCMAREAAKREARTQAVVNAPAVDVSRIAQAFEAARTNGIRKPKLDLGNFTFSRAPDHGKNPGAIYVNDGPTYLGKVAAGKFYASRDCDTATSNIVLELASNPFEAAKAYGLRTGNCSCCGRTLTNKDSIDLGIGPICRGKFGW